MQLLNLSPTLLHVSVVILSHNRQLEFVQKNYRQHNIGMGLLCWTSYGKYHRKCTTSSLIMGSGCIQPDRGLCTHSVGQGLLSITYTGTTFLCLYIRIFMELIQPGNA